MNPLNTLRSKIHAHHLPCLPAYEYMEFLFGEVLLLLLTHIKIQLSYNITPPWYFWAHAIGGDQEIYYLLQRNSP